MADASPAHLTADTDVLLVASTFSDSGAPDNGADFWQPVSGPDAGQLEGLRCAVLVFGDSTYDDFCGHGRRLDELFDALGVTRLRSPNRLRARLRGAGKAMARPLSSPSGSLRPASTQTQKSTAATARPSPQRGASHPLGHRPHLHRRAQVRDGPHR
ncbi:flavodoxin domain-containing protein [Streptomyces sp. NPDC007971]|uniref:flavodoxin domain-containing protein n=1 Tax=Streptomyces sp. NPDC007971 TaxID=3364799 RepID=UPI0036E50B33